MKLNILFGLDIWMNEMIIYGNNYFQMHHAFIERPESIKILSPFRFGLYDAFLFITPSCKMLNQHRGIDYTQIYTNENELVCVFADKYSLH